MEAQILGSAKEIPGGLISNLENRHTSNLGGDVYVWIHLAREESLPLSGPLVLIPSLVPHQIFP